GPKPVCAYSSQAGTSPHSVAREPGTASQLQSRTQDSRCATPSHGYTAADSPSPTTWGSPPLPTNGTAGAQHSSPRLSPSSSPASPSPAPSPGTSSRTGPAQSTWTHAGSPRRR